MAITLLIVPRFVFRVSQKERNKCLQTFKAQIKVSMSQTDRDHKPAEPAIAPHHTKSMNTWKHMVAHVCIWFLVIALVMVYFTSTGSPQAGLLEVGVAAFIFIALFHLVMKFFPLISKIITSIIAIGFGVALIFVNYHYLKVVKTDASFKQLLVGDLLVHKIVKTIQKEPITSLANKERPQTVPENKPENLSPEVSFDQQTTPIAKPMSSDLNSVILQVTPLAPALTTKTFFTSEKNAIYALTNNTSGEIAHLPFTVKKCAPAIRDVAERYDLSYAILPVALRDLPSAELKEPKMRPPLSEKVVSIPVQ
jgi:hypothetical protein